MMSQTMERMGISQEQLDELMRKIIEQFGPGGPGAPGGPEGPLFPPSSS